MSQTVPELIVQHNPDFILHIGMAGGRDCYSLETRGHRDGYRIKDVDDCDGFGCGEVVWKREGVPDCLLVAWDEDDVLRRWEKGVEKGLNERGFLTNEPSTASKAVSPPVPKGFSPMKTVWATAGAAPTTRAEENRKKGVVKLSRDAGRFLCEYALFESLSLRWIDAMRYEGSLQDPQRKIETLSTSSSMPPSASTAATTMSTDGNKDDETDVSHHKRRLALERLGKVAFLHVPGWTGVEDINRGAMIAEEVIRALVGSWEDGYRRDQQARIALSLNSHAKVTTEDETKFTNQNSEIDTGKATAATAMGEARAAAGTEDLAEVQWRA